MGEHRESSPQLPSCLSLLERGDQVDECAVIHSSAALGCRNGEADRQMRLANPRWTQEHDVLLAIDEAELVQTLDLLALDRGLKGKIEALERLDRRQPRGAHRRLEPAVVAQLNLCRQQSVDRLARRKLAAVDLA